MLLGVCAIYRGFLPGSLPQPAPSISADFNRSATRLALGRKPATRSIASAAVSPTPFEVKNETLGGGVLTFAVRGELDLNTAPELDEPLEKALEDRGDASILIDLSGCEFIDSTGIALIVRAWQQVTGENSGQLVVCSRNDQVRRVLDVSGLDQSIPVHATRDEGLAALGD